KAGVLTLVADSQRQLIVGHRHMAYLLFHVLNVHIYYLCGSKCVSVELLGGEKIDIVKYSDEPRVFIANALAPAEIINVDIEDMDQKICHVTVPDNQLSLAIGNKGQNARLAAKLTGWKIDIKPESGFYEPVIQL
ncbi:MAG: hypothetical protein GX264_04980, partial [Clostridiales bacterium]|nr:hypothetical protein [Clostridiales bacterium]